jgi:predicted GIY-YIG superfamily endonuclease
MPYVVYMLRFSDNSLYIGQTNNLQGRLRSHRYGASKAAKFTTDHGDFELVYQESYGSRVEAMRRERQLKGWTRAKKDALIAANKELLKKL